MATSAESNGSRVMEKEILEEWRLLWGGCIDDRLRAERIANRSFSLLDVETGTVIAATRNFRALNLKEILCSHDVENAERYVVLDSSVGGWTKFAKTVLNKQSRTQKYRAEAQPKQHSKNAQQKKGGRGWLHK